MVTVREKKYEKVWFDARAVSESAKTLSWRYMMRLPPFHEEQSADEALIDELQEVGSSRPGALEKIGGIEPNIIQITSLMRKVRQSSFEERKAYYLASRLADQRDWYHTKAAFNRTRSELWYWVVVGTQVAAIVMAILKASGFIEISPVGLLMTAAAGFSAWAQAKRHDDLKTSYSVAANELSNLGAKIELCSSETKLPAHVEDVEEAVSREHTMWRARRSIAL